MDVSDAVTTEFLEFEPDARVSKLVGGFTTRRERIAVIRDDDGFHGLVTQKQLLGSHHDPDERVSTVMRDDVPRILPTEDVRETARLMDTSQLKLLPVFEGDNFRGVVTDRSLLRLVRDDLDAITVGDVFTRDLVGVDVDAEIGEVIHALRVNRISRVPVLDGGRAAGMVSVSDLVEFTVRSMETEQGGDTGGFGSPDGTGAGGSFRTHGGWGERAGEVARMLDLPVRDVMSEPVQTVTQDRPLGDAVEEMLDRDHSSLVVVGDDDAPLGIVTTTDVLRALTVTEENRIPVQIFEIDLLDDVTREEVAEMIEDVDRKFAEMDVLEASVVLHEHKETQRGTPLLQATIRLFTDEGRFAGTGEGYGAGMALDEATDKLERNVLDEKGRDAVQRKAEDRRERNEKLLGWWLEA